MSSSSRWRKHLARSGGCGRGRDDEGLAGGRTAVERGGDGPRSRGSIKTVDAASLEGWIAIGRYVEPVPADQQAALAVMADVLGTRLNIAAREIRGLANR